MTFHMAVLFIALHAVQGLQSEKGVTVTNHAKGTFDVTIVPQAPEDGVGGPFGRMVFNKRFRGGLDGVSNGQMLASGSGGVGPSAYVALEFFEGTLNGRRGSFVLQHSGMKTKDAATLSVTVVPDSGTDELEGLTGTLRIVVTAGAHSYEFDYALPASRLEQRGNGGE